MTAVPLRTQWQPRKYVKYTQVNGGESFPHPRGSETPEPIQLKFA